MRRLLIACLCLIAAAPLAPYAARAEDPAPLPALGANPKAVSVSGLSSGGYMAAQYGVAFSEETIGVGVIAGGPYGCGWTYLRTMGPAFLDVCMKAKPSPPETDSSWDVAMQAAGTGLIGSLRAIPAQRIYLFTGKEDEIVVTPVMAVLRDFYRAAGAASPNLVYVDTINAGHAFIARASGNECGTDAAPYVEHCTVGAKIYDQPEAILTHIYGKLKPLRGTLPSAPIPFDQRPYGSAGARMASTGYLYVPAACRKPAASCAVHVVFHGCLQSAAKEQDRYTARSATMNGPSETGSSSSTPRSIRARGRTRSTEIPTAAGTGGAIRCPCSASSFCSRPRRN